jgi:hypothetical protein
LQIGDVAIDRRQLRIVFFRNCYVQVCLKRNGEIQKLVLNELHHADGVIGRSLLLSGKAIRFHAQAFQ